MLRDLKRESVTFGLEIHFGKTVIFTNNLDAANSESVKTDSDASRLHHAAILQSTWGASCVYSISTV